MRVRLQIGVKRDEIAAANGQIHVAVLAGGAGGAGSEKDHPLNRVFFCIFGDFPA